MPQEHNIQDACSEQAQRAEHPDDKGEQHRGVDDGLLVVLIGDGFDVGEELRHARLAVVVRAIDEFGLHDSV